MQIRLWVVGKGDPAWQTFEQDMLRRIRAYAQMDLAELPEGRGRRIAQRRQQETRTILQRVPDGFILFDERGQSLTSRQWAAFMARQPGKARIDMLIGGAAGVTDAVRERAGACWSLSALTLPHRLARALVIEQCYRAFTILAGHPYHRE